MNPGPHRPDLKEGLGELMLAYRTYTGLSQRVFAEKLGIRENSLSDIEIGRRPCADAVMDRAEEITREFDTAVNEVIERATELLKDQPEDVVRFPVSRETGQEWVRAVVGRAAAESGLIVPTLDGIHVMT